METIKERLEAYLLEATAEKGIWWVDKDNSKWNVTNNIDFTDGLEAFIAQELTLLAESVGNRKHPLRGDSMPLKHWCSQTCPNSPTLYNEAIEDAAAIIRAHVKDLEE